MLKPVESISRLRRPLLVTTVGILGIIAGTLPLLEAGAVLASRRFRAKFLPAVQAILPTSVEMILALLLLIAVADLALGVGVLSRRRWAMPGMILRSILGVGVDYLNFHANNRSGALFGLAMNVFVVWALLCPRSRDWFHIVDG